MGFTTLVDSQWDWKKKEKERKKKGITQKLKVKFVCFLVNDSKLYKL